MGNKSPKTTPAHKAMVKKCFDKLDKNGDGVISISELQDVLTMKRSAILQGLQRIDSDGDSAINFDEFCKLVQKRFMDVRNKK
mmetsp:Transcript_112/g.118  ORF Transcript_112/g.118 Transcript_112/m.118 type:complete len:83 (-) Transcript_112:322-570(-)